MNNKTITILIVAIVAFAAGYLVSNFTGGKKIQTEAQVNLTNDWDSLSYFLGLSIGYSGDHHRPKAIRANTRRSPSEGHAVANPDGMDSLSEAIIATVRFSLPSRRNDPI